MTDQQLEEGVKLREQIKKATEELQSVQEANEIILRDKAAGYNWQYLTKPWQDDNYEDIIRSWKDELYNKIFPVILAEYQHQLKLLKDEYEKL